MTVTQLLQLYAPLAGLLAVVFWLGVLSNRVLTLEREVRDLKERAKAETDERERIVRMEVKMDDMKEKLESVGRELATVHRQLANMVSRRGGKIVNLDPEG